VAGQVLNASFIAIMLGLGMTYAQQQHPSGAGFATSVFFGAQALSVATGGLTGGGSAATLGLPSMFLVPAGLCVAGGLLLLVTPHPPSPAE
jgi:SET family sugar efflux transporter-like MFS transporter